MSQFDIQLNTPEFRFEPGDRLEGVATWRLDRPMTALEVRLIWYTLGKGTTDTGYACANRVERPPDEGRQPFSFTLPKGPYSFSGKLVSLCWALEIATVPRGENFRKLILIGPGRSEVILPGV